MVPQYQNNRIIGSIGRSFTVLTPLEFDRCLRPARVRVWGRGRWTNPASGVKAGREFAVPLSTGTLYVLERAHKLSNALVRLLGGR